MAEPLFNRFEQICFVVEDVYRAMDLFIECGIGPFKIMRFGDAGDGCANTVSIENVRLHGRSTGTYAIIAGLCMLPESGVELELIQPLTGESIFAEYLHSHGPGVQHLSISHVPFDEAMERIRAAGFETSQIATVDVIETCVFSDHREVIGSYLELHKRPEGFQMPDIEDELYPVDGRMPLCAAPAFTEINTLGIAVDSVERAEAVLGGEYGLGPWHREGEKAVCESLNVRLELLPGERGEEHARRAPDVVYAVLTRTGPGAPEGYQENLGVVFKG